MGSKGEIRKRIVGRRDSLTREEIEAGSRAIFERLAGLEAILRASTLMVYLSFGSEVRTDELIRWGWGEGKTIAVPLCRPGKREIIPCRIDGFDQLETGHYGILEPKAALCRPVGKGTIGVVVVPAVAFDKMGRRVGYGGGYYDRFLPEVPQAAKVGTAFACQIVPEVPSEAYDVPVDCIVTEEGTIVPPFLPLTGYPDPG